MENLTVGQAIAKHRREAKLTQDELGRKVGYGEGAGVSISRIETGKVIPNETRVGQIATKLSLSDAQLKSLQRLRSADAKRAEDVRAPAKKQSLRERKQGIDLKLQQRIIDTQVLAEENQEAIELASSKFFNEFIDIASQINGAPSNELHAARIKGALITPSVRASLAQDHFDFMAQRIGTSFTGYAGRAIIKGGAFGALSALSTYIKYLDIAQNGMASTGKLNSEIFGAARTSSIRAAMAGGTLANGGPGVAGAPRAIYGTIATTVAAGVILSIANSTVEAVRERHEALKLIAKQEELFERSEHRFLAWQDTVRRGAEILTYIGIHGAHALAKWREELGELPVEWSDLTEDQRLRFQQMLTIAACESSIDMAPTEQMMQCPDSDYEEIKAELNATLTTADLIVKSLV